MIEFVKIAAETVYDEMGGFHSEAVYEACMALELNYTTHYPVIRQIPCPFKYKGYTVGIGFIDLRMGDLIIELKAVAKLTPKDTQQVQKYLHALDLEDGLLINFGNDLEIVEIQKAGSHGKTYSAEG